MKQPVDPMKLADSKTRIDWIENKNMKAFNFYKDDELKEVDIIIETPVSYEDGRTDLVMVKVGDVTLPLLSINNLIKMKKDTGRAIDKIDIEELEKIKKLKKTL